MKPQKPSKPYAAFPLTANGNGQWSKKFRGKVYYYGAWADPMGALEKFYKSKQYHENGVAAPADCGTVDELVTEFLADKDRAVANGELDQGSYDGYRHVAEAVRGQLRDRPLSSLIYPDFTRLRSSLADDCAITTLNRRLTVARMLFKFAEKLGPAIRYDGLQAPPAKMLRQARNDAGERLFTADQIRGMIADANGIAPMIYLGINCAYGPADCLSLEGRFIDGDWINYPRPKTAVKRRCWLWPETVAALPNTKGLLFPDFTRQSLKHQFGKLIEGYHTKGAGIYNLRRTFETIAVTSDVPQCVVDTIMGHTDRSMAAVYRQRVFDQQLRKCSEHVRAWLLGEIELD